MFPETAYANKSWDGLPIKILKAKNNCPEALKVANWLSGAFDALEKKYLRELILVVYKDNTEPDIVDEIYTFKFSYPDGQATCQLLQGKNEVKSISDNEVYKSAQNLLRSLVILTQGMSPIEESHMTMKLTYYDEVTPVDYEPCGFLPTPLVQPQLPAGIEGLQLGQVNTLYHGVHLEVKTMADQGEESRQLSSQQQVPINQNQVNNTQQPQTKTPEMNFPISSPRPRSANLKPSKSPSSFIRSGLGIVTPQSQGSLAPSSISLLSDHSEATSSKVQCVCMNTHPDLIMLDCHHCSFQQHASCYRIFSVEDVPNQHCCVTCSEELGVKCTDSRLVKMSSNPGIAGTCLFRRFLFYLLQVQVIKVESVMEMLGIPWDTAEALIGKVGGKGCLKDDDDIEGQWKIVHEVLESEIVPKFIGKKGRQFNVSGGNASKSVSQKDELSGGGDKRMVNVNTEVEKRKKSSVVMDAFQMCQSGEKRRLLQEEDLDGQKMCKKKKVSQEKASSRGGFGWAE